MQIELNDGTVVCTYCSHKKDQSERLLPAIKRYRSDRIQRVAACAYARGLRFLILSGKFGLIGEDYAIPNYDHLLQPSEVEALAERIANKLREEDIRHLEYVTKPVEMDEKLRPYLDTLQIACREADASITVRDFYG